MCRLDPAGLGGGDGDSAFLTSSWEMLACGIHIDCQDLGHGQVWTEIFNEMRVGHELQ